MLADERVVLVVVVGAHEAIHLTHGPGVVQREADAGVVDVLRTLTRSVGVAARAGARRTDIGVVDRVEERGGEIHPPVVRDLELRLDLDALGGLLARVAQHEAGTAESVVLEALDRLVEERDIHRGSRPTALQADLVDRRLLGVGLAGAEARVVGVDGATERRTRGHCRRQRLAVARQVPRGRLVTGRHARVGVDVVRHIEGETHRVGELTVVRLVRERHDRVQELQRVEAKRGVARPRRSARGAGRHAAHIGEGRLRRERRDVRGGRR